MASTVRYYVMHIIYIIAKHKKMVLIKITTTMIPDFQRLYFSFNSTINLA